MVTLSLFPHAQGYCLFDVGDGLTGIELRRVLDALAEKIARIIGEHYADAPVVDPMGDDEE